MKSFYLNCTLLLIGVTCIVMGRINLRSNRSVIKAFPQRDVDIGKAAAGDEHRVTFRIRNVQDNAITLVSIHPDCGCTQLGESSTVFPASLAPSESMDLVFKWKVAFADSTNSIRRKIGLHLLCDGKSHFEFLTLSATRSN